jgi:hypothetical protein
LKLELEHARDSKPLTGRKTGPIDLDTVDLDPLA